MGQIRHAEMMFRGVSYNKFTSIQVREAMLAKVAALQAKIEERRARVTALMETHRIDNAALSDILVQYMKDQQSGHARMSYSNRVSTGGPDPLPAEMNIPAGVIANLVTEKELIESEKTQVARLTLITLHLHDTEPAVATDGSIYRRWLVHTLTDDEIEYLGI